MKKLIGFIVISLIVSSIVLFTTYFFVPLLWLDNISHLFSPHTLGSTITVINGSDTLSNSRTTINNNFSALNVGKVENSDLYATTTMTQIISLPNLITSALQTVGTIMTGVWNGTAIGVGFGGTGTTTPTLNQVMIGNGSSGFKVVGFGTSGQFLQSNGNGIAPSWLTISGSTLTTLYTFGETIAIATPVYIESVAQTVNVASATAHGGTDNIDDTMGFHKFGEAFTESQSYLITSLAAGVSKTGSPTGNITLSIESDSAGSPSGIDLQSCTISAGSVTGSFQRLSCTFATPYSTNGGTKYHLVATGNGVDDAANYWIFYRDASDTYANGYGERYTTSWTSLAPNDITFAVSDVHTVGYIYPTSAKSINSSVGYIGFVQSNTNALSSGNVITSGNATGFSGLSIGLLYYLADATSTIGTSAGTNSHKALIGTSATTGQVINSF